MLVHLGTRARHLGARHDDSFKSSWVLDAQALRYSDAWPLGAWHSGLPESSRVLGAWALRYSVILPTQHPAAWLSMSLMTQHDDLISSGWGHVGVFCWLGMCRIPTVSCYFSFFMKTHKNFWQKTFLAFFFSYHFIIDTRYTSVWYEDPDSDIVFQTEWWSFENDFANYLLIFIPFEVI